MPLYEQFRTNTDREVNGISLNYGDFRVLIARAGGANKNYLKMFQKLTQPYRRAIDTNTMSNELQIEVLIEVFARSVILNWETLVDGEWKVGIEDEKGKIIPVTPENIITTLKNLPDLFMDIKAQAESTALWRDAILVESAKN